MIHPLYVFTSKTQLLDDDSGYDAAVKDDTLRDTLVFDFRSDKDYKDAIALGNSLTFKHVYTLSTIDQNAKAQMKGITQRENKSDFHAVQSKRSPMTQFKVEISSMTQFKGSADSRFQKIQCSSNQSSKK